MSEILPRCPICTAALIATHCPSPTCSWVRCKNQPCGAVLDLKHRRGYRSTPQGYKRLSFGGPSTTS